MDEALCGCVEKYEADLPEGVERRRLRQARGTP